MERSPLNNREIVPSHEQISVLLQNACPVYDEFILYLADEQNGLNPVWMYYNDVKYWLCKVQHKKKTVFWLTIWDGYFKLTFYFTEKVAHTIDSLDIDQSLKEQYQANKQVGKIKPVTLDLHNRGQLKDAYTLIEYKKSLK
jgi:hypothetical protein